jgi:anti-anti-sigma factor
VTTVELRTRLSGGFAVVMLRGKLDVTDAGATAAAVAALVTSGQQLIIDLEALDFIDCDAVGALLGVREAARQAGGDVLLAAPHGPVLRLLNRLDVPGVHASLAAAVNRAGGRDTRRPMVATARFRAASAGAWYWWALRSGPVPGARAAGLPWSPRRLRARSGPRG